MLISLLQLISLIAIQFTLVLMSQFSMPSPVCESQLDFLMHKLQNKKKYVYISKKNLESEQEQGNIKNEIEQNSYLQRRSGAETNCIESSQQQRNKNKEKTQGKELKNVLPNLKLRILTYLAQQKVPRSKALLNFKKAQSLNMKFYQQLFREETLHQVLSNMFEQKYLIRAYQISRVSLINKTKHFRRIRQLNKRFILANKPGKRYP